MKTSLEIHQEATEAARARGEAYIAEHGEPMYCGFAWVNIAPGTSKFARDLKKAGVVNGRSYYGGVDVWNPGGIPTQSMDIKEACADTYVKVLGTYGIRATAMSRAD
tara:strand:- start:825 stop:1145 length:321 start_codon:yes stop_codon:yes gene_type:complete